MGEPKVKRGPLVEVVGAAERRWSQPIPDGFLPLFEAAGLVVDDHDSQVIAYRDGKKAGAVWGPAVEGHWFAYRHGSEAVRVATRDAGLLHLLLPLKAITVRNPWARAIAVGAKTVENRGADVKHRGLLAVHAGKTPDSNAEADPRLVDLFGPNPLAGAPRGAVVAVVTLVDCHRAVYDAAHDRTCCPPFGERWHASASVVRDAWHLVLDAVCPVDPVPASGRLPVPWTLPDDVATDVLTQLVEPAEVRCG